MEQANLTALRREIAAIEGRPAGFGENGLTERLILDVRSVPVLSHDLHPPLEGEGRAGWGDGTGTGTSTRKVSGLKFTPTRSAPQSDLPPPGGGEPEVGNRLVFGVESVDRRLGGGLPVAALHEIRCDETRAGGALTGFAATLLARLASVTTKPILWVEEEMALGEAGHPFGPGLARFGLDPSRLIFIRARRAEDALWTLEEGLRCTGLAAVLAVIRASPHALDLTASRRLALRAAAHGVMGLLLRQASEAEPGAATTRWRIRPQPAAATDGFTEGIGRPAWRAELEKNRLGPVGSFDLEWDHAQSSFVQSAAADPVARPALPFDRPDRTADARAGLALRETG
jgi:protein ImuA